MKPITQTLAILPVVIGLVASESTACTSRRTNSSPVATVHQIDATSWYVTVPGWQTLAIPSGRFCAVGLSVQASGAITSVDSFRMTNETTGSTIDALPFAANAAVATALNGQQTGNWTGFLGQASAAIPANVPIRYCFRVTTAANTTAATLRTQLTSARVGSDESNAQGGLTNNSQVIFQFTSATEDDIAHNSRLFHNELSSNVSTRLTVNSDDTLYFMQPRQWRFGQGDGTGWQARMQDQDPTTAETVTLGWIKYAGATSLLPDVTATGATSTASFSLFGAGGSQAVDWTLTSCGKMSIDRSLGISIVLPAPANAWPTDGCTLHTQDGTTSNLLVNFRQQWTYALNGSSAAAFRPVGSTMHLGGLYDCPTQQPFNLTSSYGPQRRLLGAETIRPDTLRGEFFGVIIRSERSGAGTVALVIVTPGYSPVAIPTPFKDYLVQAQVTTAVVPIVNGVGQSIGFPLGGNGRLGLQTIILDFTTIEGTFTDATLIRSQPRNP